MKNKWSIFEYRQVELHSNMEKEKGEALMVFRAYPKSFIYKKVMVTIEIPEQSDERAEREFVGRLKEIYMEKIQKEFTGKIEELSSIATVSEKEDA